MLDGAEPDGILLPVGRYRPQLQPLTTPRCPAYWWRYSVSVTTLFGHALLNEGGEAGPRTVAAVVPQIVLEGAGCFSATWLSARLTVLLLERANRRQRLPKLLREAVSAGWYLAALMATVALALDGDVTGSLATSGVVIAILGFAVRNVIADVVLGMALGLERSYRIGDWVKIDNGVSGAVVEINWRTTRLLTRNQTQVILPNSRIAQRQFVNYSATKRHYREQMRICLPHSLPVAEAKRVLLAAAQSVRRNDAGPPPDVRAIAYTPGGIDYAIHYWIPTYAEEADCRDALLCAIDAALRREGLHVGKDASDPVSSDRPTKTGSELRSDDTPGLRLASARTVREEA